MISPQQINKSDAEIKSLQQKLITEYLKCNPNQEADKKTTKDASYIGK
jgi:hypothetical protein